MLLSETNLDLLKDMYQVKRELIILSKHIRPIREVVSGFLKRNQNWLMKILKYI